VHRAYQTLRKAEYCVEDRNKKGDKKSQNLQQKVEQ
jgi:hypothetical protein